MKKKILYIILAILLIVDIVITKQIGLKVSLYYAEGYTITFKEKDTIELSEVKEIAKDIWGENFLIQNVEFFNDSAIIKVKEIKDGQISELYTKLNEKYSSELNEEDIKVEHVSNVKISTLVEPYIIPIGLSFLLIIAYYAVRYKGVRQMVSLLKYLLIGALILYSVYALFRVPIGSFTMPLYMTLYFGITLAYTIISEKKFESNKN